MASYRYWRVKATTMHGSSSGYMGCMELRFLTDWDGPQAATGGTAISDSAFAGTTASNAFDGSELLWASNGTGTASYIGYDFGSAVEVKEVWYTPRPTSTNQIFTAANIDGSDDGSAWTTVVSWTPAAWTSGGTQAKTVQGTKPADGTAGAGSHRYWRILARTMHANSGGFMAADEVVWRTAVSGSQVATGGTAIAGTSDSAAALPANAYDGDFAPTANACWASNGIGFDWIGYDFGTAKHIAEVAYSARNDASYRQIFTAAVVQSSDDAVTWTTAATLTPGAWSQGQTQTFTVQTPAAAPSARPVVFIST